MRKTIRLGLSAWMICLTVSCSRFSWEATHYVGDHKNGQIISQYEKLKCEEPRFEDFVCFKADDIAALHAEIAKINKRN